MPKNNYLLNSESHIIKLKSDLMISDNNSVISYSSEYYKNRNSEIGEVFEENIKNTLNFEFGWEKGDISEHFYYRIVKLDEDEYVLMRDGKLAFNINGKKYFLISKPDNISLKRGKAILKRYDNNGAKKINEIISQKKLIIEKETEIEVDGYFKISNLDFSTFNDDFSILYMNINEEDIEEATNALIEIKLNKRKLPEMINQIKADRNIYEKIAKDKIIYIGIVGYSERKHNIDINLEEELDGINCIILQMENFNFCGRNMKKSLDWKIIKEVQQMKQDIFNLKDDVVELKSSVSKLESSVAKLESSVAKLESSVNEVKRDLKVIKNFLIKKFKKDEKMLGKKRTRMKKENN